MRVGCFVVFCMALVGCARNWPSPRGDTASVDLRPADLGIVTDAIDGAIPDLRADAVIDGMIDGMIDGAPTADAPQALSSITDDFSGPLDTSKWIAASGACTMQPVAGVLEITIAQSTKDKQYCFLHSRGRFDLERSSVTFRWLPPHDTTVGLQRVLSLALLDEQEKWVGDYYAFTEGMGFHLRVNGVAVAQSSYDIAAKPWWRMRQIENKVVFEVAATSAGPWTELGDAPLLSNLERVRLGIGFGRHKILPSSVARIDCVNVIGPPGC
jgi:hypothetical protein